MTEMELIELLTDIQVLRQGHFLLTSGRHSDRFLLSSQLTMHPKATATLIQLLAQKVRKLGLQPTVVIGPAMGGVILAYEMARQLECKAFYAEKEGSGMALKRGFTLLPEDRILLIEDAISTGGSLNKVITALEAYREQIQAVAVLFDRTKGETNFGVIPLVSLLELEIPSWEEQDCPLCKQGIPLVAPKL